MTTPPKKSWITPGISTGNVLTISLVIGSALVQWGVMQAAMADHERRILKSERNIETIRTEQRNATMGFTELKTDMKHLIAELARTRQAIERLDRERRTNPR